MICLVVLAPMGPQLDHGPRGEATPAQPPPRQNAADELGELSHHVFQRHESLLLEKDEARLAAGPHKGSVSPRSASRIRRHRPDLPTGRLPTASTRCTRYPSPGR